jgi:3-methyladenine DNA glycosylase AlkD
MLATFHFIKCGESEDALAIARMLREDPEDLIHKAVGWMLREVGKRADAAALRAFLDTEAPHMPRTMLRYAIEHFGDAERQHYLGLRNRHRQFIN